MMYELVYVSQRTTLTGNLNLIVKVLMQKGMVPKGVHLRACRASMAAACGRNAGVQPTIPSVTQVSGRHAGGALLHV